MQADVETRIVDLEIRLTHQEQGLQILSDSLVHQQKTLDALLAQLGVLVKQLQVLSAPGESVDEAPPPHY